MVRRQNVVHELDIFELLPDWVWLRDPEGTVLDVNAAALRGTGYDKGELLGRSISEFYYDPKDAALDKAWIRRVLAAGSGDFPATLRDKIGRPVAVEQKGRLVRLGAERAVLVTARDIGEQARDRRLALTLYEAFRRSNEVMFYCDRNGTILDVNEAFSRHYGWSREEAVGRTPRILRSRHSSDELYKRMWEAILTKGHWRGEMINQAKAGREIPLVLTITAVRDGAGEIVGYISNAVDMTEHLALQARVADSEALASLGEMAAVVAHEIRNPLSSIVMAAKELASGSELNAEDRDVVMRVLRHESQRLNEALTNFLSFARPRELKLARSDLNGLIEETARMIESNAELKASTQIVLSLSKELKPFPMDADQLRQVVWNLMINALQALAGGGKLSVRTGRSGGRAFFEVEDTGPGIPEAMRASMFKPFQTTKQQGTGLGLAIAERIVK
ncbi:MAG: PAS domain S-box protein, partial [Elusimicrobia bacterium]|nr:PAS domain S-box protein [Elusimicrobiota bacterium]